MDNPRLAPVRSRSLLLAILALSVAGVHSGCAVLPGSKSPQRDFSFAANLDLGAPASTLSVGRVAIEGTAVRVDGVDTSRPSLPFVFGWGDGTTSESWFPAAHTYAQAGRNYVIRVVARHADVEQVVTTCARFVPARYSYERRADVPRRVFIPDVDVALGSTMAGYHPPSDLTHFEDSEVSGVPRDVIEYVLDVAHRIQLDLCNADVVNEAINRQVVLKQTSIGGCCSLWFTDPVSFACHPAYLVGEVGFSSLFHELAHNLTLNSPAAYRFGGKTDGPMNCIVSETLAQIFQHATVYDILNAPGRYGLSEETCRLIRESGSQSIGAIREAHRRYLADPARYTTYDDPASEIDDTFDTFMTVAYTFCCLAEERGDYRGPLTRMMRLMQTFREPDRVRFQQRDDEPFRATFLIAAMSYGFDMDLRQRFQKLNFPIADAVYTELLSRGR